MLKRRHRSILASIPFDTGVDIKKLFATRWLVDLLALLGLSISSDEVKLFKQSAAVSDSIEATETEHFTQWVGDNVNYNIGTLTGEERLHGMKFMSIPSNSNSNFKAISRRQHKSVTNFADCGGESRAKLWRQLLRFTKTVFSIYG